MRNLHTLAKKKHVIGIENVKFLKDHLCGACEAGKMTKAKHPAKTIMTTTHPFELLHMDLFGPNHYSAVTNQRQHSAKQGLPSELPGEQIKFIVSGVAISVIQVSQAYQYASV